MRLEQEKTITALLTNDPALQPLEGELLRAHALLREAFSGGGKLLVCGNGGSAADSAHVVGELMKGFRKRRPLPPKEAEAVQAVPQMPQGFAARLQQALPAIDLTAQAALLTAFANDVDPDMVFAQQVYGYGRAGDALLALTTSGNSKNVVNAVHAAAREQVARHLAGAVRRAGGQGELIIGLLVAARVARGARLPPLGHEADVRHAVGAEPVRGVIPGAARAHHERARAKDLHLLPPLPS